MPVKSLLNTALIFGLICLPGGIYSKISAPGLKKLFSRPLSRVDDSCAPVLFPRLQNRGSCVSMDNLESCNQEFGDSGDCPNGFCCYQSTAQGNSLNGPRRNLPQFFVLDITTNLHLPKLMKKVEVSTTSATEASVPTTTEPSTTTSDLTTTIAETETTAATTISEATPESTTTTSAAVEVVTLAAAAEVLVPEPVAVQEATAQPAAPETPVAVPEPVAVEVFTQAAAAEVPIPVPDPVLGQSCDNNDQCGDSGTTCFRGQCRCWWDQGNAAARVWACNTDQQCERSFPNHVCRPTKLCRQFSGNMGFCIPVGALRK